MYLLIFNKKPDERNVANFGNKVSITVCVMVYQSLQKNVILDI